MKKILSISWIIILTSFRRGAGWGLLGLCSFTAVFMFFVTSSDSSLVNELNLRLRYSLYSLTLVLNVSLMYMGCVSLRKDIDDRRFHTISAAPVCRWQIWSGHFLGLTALGMAAFLSACAALAVACTLFIHLWDKEEDKRLLHERFFSTYFRCEPDLSQVMEGIWEEYHRRVAEHDLLHDDHEDCDDEDHHHDDVWKSRKVILDEIKKERQIINPGESGSWVFNWNPHAARGEFILLRFKVYSNVQRALVKGNWRLLDGQGKVFWDCEFSDYPFLQHELKIPLEKVPRDKKLTLSFTEAGGHYIIFPVHHGGLVMLYNSGGILKNFCMMALFTVIHTALLVGLSLSLSSIFSFSVALFVTMSAYMTGFFSGFFSSVLYDLSFYDPGPWRNVLSAFLKLGLWLTEGTKAPPVCRMFSDGISVPVSGLVAEWAPGFAAYFIMVAAAGVAALTVKEIDKILQS